MTSQRLPRPSALAWLAAGLVWVCAAASAHAAQPGDVVREVPGLGSAHAAPGERAQPADASPDWRALSPAQKRVLQPLGPHWSSMDATSREKWLNIANRFDRLGPGERQRVQERMDQWAKLPAQQRGEARLRFQQTRQISPDERQKRWAEYQALPAEDREGLTRRAERKAKPVFLSNSDVGPREARQAYAAKRRSADNASARKSNVVPNAAPGMASARTVVRPAIVKAGTGATTNLVTQRPALPMHQQTGLPKIAATKGFVDPVTLLPRKGAQGAAMVQPTAPQPPEAPRAPRK